MQPDDTYVLNDPYCGGTHLPDIAVVQPIFANGQGERLHRLQRGDDPPPGYGRAFAGSVPTNATEIFQEGLRIPPLKFRDRGVVNATLEAMIRQNVRIPDTVMGDIHAQVSACSIGARRLAELAEKQGDNAVTAIFARISRQVRGDDPAALAQIPDGTYRAVDWLDNDGMELDKPIRIEVAVTIAGDSFHSTSPAPARRCAGH